MQTWRLIRHATATHWRTRMLFSGATLDAIEQAIARAELTHAGEIRFAVETALAPLHILNGVTPRGRALDVFAHLRVWDTEHNNGVLIYVQVADRDVEIVADRGFEGTGQSRRMGGGVPPDGRTLPRRAVSGGVGGRGGCHCQFAGPPLSSRPRPVGRFAQSIA